MQAFFCSFFFFFHFQRAFRLGWEEDTFSYSGWKGKAIFYASPSFFLSRTLFDTWHISSLLVACCQQIYEVWCIRYFLVTYLRTPLPSPLQPAPSKKCHWLLPLCRKSKQIHAHRRQNVPAIDLTHRHTRDVMTYTPQAAGTGSSSFLSTILALLWPAFLPWPASSSPGVASCPVKIVCGCVSFVFVLYCPVLVLCPIESIEGFFMHYKRPFICLYWFRQQAPCGVIASSAILCPSPDHQPTSVVRGCLLCCTSEH